MYVEGAGYPSLAEVRAWLKVAATVLPDEQLATIAAAEQTAQSRALEWTTTGGDAPDDVVAAFYRRCARHAAAKGVPLGVLGADAEYGAVRLAKWDGEVDRLEASYLVIAIA